MPAKKKAKKAKKSKKSRKTQQTVLDTLWETIVEAGGYLWSLVMAPVNLVINFTKGAYATIANGLKRAYKASKKHAKKAYKFTAKQGKRVYRFTVKKATGAKRLAAKIYKRGKKYVFAAGDYVVSGAKYFVEMLHAAWTKGYEVLIDGPAPKAKRGRKSRKAAAAATA
jgi:hypothetical protein